MPRSEPLPSHLVPYLLVCATVALSGCGVLGQLDTEREMGSAKGASFKTRPMANPPKFTMKWAEQIAITPPWEPLTQEYAAPVVVPRSDELVVGTSLGDVLRMDASTAREVWRVSLVDEDGRARPVHASPTVSDGRVYVPTLAGAVFALDYASGEVLWRFTASDAVESSLTEADGRLLFMDSREVLYALDSSSGKVLWRYQRRTPEFFTIKGASAPVVDGDVAYCGFADGTLVAIQLDVGEPIWTADLGNEQPEFTDVDMPVIVRGEYLYAGSYAGGIYAIKRMDGQIAWRFELDSIARMVIDGEVMLLASAQGRVVAVDLTRKKQLWSFRFSTENPVELSLRAPYVFVSTSAGPLTVLDRATGAPLARWMPSHGFNTPLVVSGNRAFALSNGGYLYAMELSRR
ncbi:MAG: PQQ-binding-like beta-propeller repeat protein [Myxococcota bacterium]